MRISRPCMILGCVLLAAGSLVRAKNGKHAGEARQLNVNISFSGSSGLTVTDASGIHYHMSGTVVNENKVYPSQYWGTYPLFFFGQTVGVTVTIANAGPREVAKVKIVTDAYVLMTNGSNGGQLAPKKEIEVEVRKGETKTIDASFVAQATPAAESGLDRFFVKVLHPNQGGGPGNAEPGLIMVKEGVFCPPKYRK